MQMIKWRTPIKSDNYLALHTMSAYNRYILILLSRRYAKELQLDLIRRVMTFIYEISCLLVYRIHYLLRRLNKNVSILSHSLFILWT